MELRHLRYFSVVAETLHFSRAAEHLHLTQPALSRQIRDLETELGVRLLHRHHTQTALTPAGERFARRAREILGAADRAVEEARSLGRQLRFGHYGTLWVEHFAPVLRAFAKRHPGYTLEPIEMTPVELLTALRRQEIDFALLGHAAPGTRRDLEVQPLCEVEAMIALAGDHPLAKKRRLALAELRGESWIVWDEASFPGRAELLFSAARRAGFSPRVTAKVDSVASMFMTVATSRAVGYVLPMSKKLPHSGVVFAQLRPPGIRFTMHAAWRHDAAHVIILRELARTLSQVGTSA